MRALFSRQDVAGGFLSLRNSLAAHVGGAGIGLREALDRFDRLDDGSGFEAGCRKPSSLSIGLRGLSKDIGQIFPAWVAVGPRDHRQLSRTLEGILVKSKVTKEDFPLKPWHTFYDWNFHVRVDRQYRYLLNEVTRTHHSHNILGKDIRPEDIEDIIECEWDTAFLPLWAIPQIGSRIQLVGRWIYDCGHPEPPPGAPNTPEAEQKHRTEIHPPKAVISFRSEAALFDGNDRPTRANQAVVFIGQKGGYFDQSINDQDYAFDLLLPPRPDPAAQPVFQVRGVRGMGDELPASLVVRPVITPFPARNPRLLRVVIPLKGHTPEPEVFGAVIAAGWTDPNGTEALAVRRLKITVSKVRKGAVGTPAVAPAGSPLAMKWLFYLAINGRWHRVELDDIHNDLDISVTLDLHEEDAIHVTACGFAMTQIHQFMGKSSGVPVPLTSEASTIEEATSAAEQVRSAFVDFANIPGTFSNVGLTLFSRFHPPRPVVLVNVDSRDHRGPAEAELNVATSYRLDYKIEEA